MLRWTTNTLKMLPLIPLVGLVLGFAVGYAFHNETGQLSPNVERRMNPSPTVGSPSPPASPGATETPAAATHVVEAGDTLTSIAERYDTSVEELLRLNDLNPVDLLDIGEVLQIPGQSR